MTRKTNARLAGCAFLIYIAAAFPSAVLFRQATSVAGIAGKLAQIAQAPDALRVTVILSLISAFSALVLGVSLYGITRAQDHEFALLAMACRVGEGIVNAILTLGTVLLLSLATGLPAADTAGSAATNALGKLLLTVRDSGTSVSAILFAVGSTIFSLLLLRGRLIPSSLAWLGAVSSALLVAVLPAELAGFIDPVSFLIWMPMLAFELTIAVWLLIKGAATPALQSRIGLTT